MVIISFSRKTSKIMPRIFCKKFRHCAPIIPTPGGVQPYVMHQFVRPGHVVKIPLTVRDMNMLRAAGWVMVAVNVVPHTDDMRGAKTCVQLARRAIGWRNRIWIQRPDALYRSIRKNQDIRL